MPQSLSSNNPVIKEIGRHSVHFQIKVNFALLRPRNLVSYWLDEQMEFFLPTSTWVLLNKLLLRIK